MVLVNLAAGAAGAFVGRKAFAHTKKLAFEKYKYDFIGLAMQLATFFVLAWLVEVYMKGRLFFNDPVQQNILVGSVFGIGGLIIKFIGEQFLKEEKEMDIPLIDNPRLRELFSDGVTDAKIQYWDIIKGIAIMFVTVEWMQWNELNNNDPEGKGGVMTHGIFGMIVAGLILLTVPKFTGRIKELKVLN